MLGLGTINVPVPCHIREIDKVEKFYNADILKISFIILQMSTQYVDLLF